MKALLVVDANSTVDRLVQHVARRFPQGDVDLHVLYLKHDDGSAATAGRKRSSGVAALLRRPPVTQAMGPEQRVQDLMSRLQQLSLRSVHTHIQSGKPVELIINACLHWDCALLLLEAPQRHWLLTARESEAVPLTLLGRVPCAVELIRDIGSSEPDAMTVLAPVEANTLGSFPFARLQTLPWKEGDELHLLGVLPPAVSDTATEVNPAAVIRSLKAVDRAAALALAELSELQQQLEQILPAEITVTAEVATGDTREVAVDYVKRTKPDWIAIATPTDEDADRGCNSLLSPAAIALSAPCSVLVLPTLDAAIKDACEPVDVRFASSASMR